MRNKIYSLILISIILGYPLYIFTVPIPKVYAPDYTDTILQFREYTDDGNAENVRFQNESSGWFMENIVAAGVGYLWAWMGFDADWIDGKRLNISSAGSSTAICYHAIIDGPYDRTDGSQFKNNSGTDNPGTVDQGNGVLQQLKFDNTWANETASYLVNINATFTQVTLIFMCRSTAINNVAAQYVYGFGIYETGSSSYLFFEGLSGDIIMETTGDWAYGTMQAENPIQESGEITLSSDTEELFTGQTLTFTSQYTLDDIGVQDLDLSIQRSEDNSTWEILGNQTSDSSGIITLIYAQDQTGTWYFRSQYAGNGNPANVSSSLSILFNQASGGNGNGNGNGNGDIDDIIDDFIDDIIDIIDDLIDWIILYWWLLLLLILLMIAMIISGREKKGKRGARKKKNKPSTKKRR
jgi:hypothetical protein